MGAIALHDVRVDEGPNAVGRTIRHRSGHVVVLISTLDDLATVSDSGSSNMNAAIGGGSPAVGAAPAVNQMSGPTAARCCE